MKVDYIVSCLEKTQIAIEENKRSGNNLATVLKLSNGCIINCYDSGKVVYQGKNTDEVKNIIEHTAQTVRKEEKNRNVLVVYGHDLNARTQLEAMLRRWDIEPLKIDQLVSSG